MANEIQSQRDSQQSAKSSARTSLKDFTRPWAKLCAAYPQSEPSKPTLMLFYDKLCRYDIEQIIAAVDGAIERCKFFPSVAEILANIQERPIGRHPMLDEPRPTKEEAGAVIAKLGEFIAESKKQDEERRRKRIDDRRAVLKQQADFLNGK